jgi:trans-aconitate 2-methyltransferase
MKTDWDPKQYNKFKEQRARPFYDLMHLIKPPITSLLDLGCGTGELTQVLHAHLNCQNSLAVDSSENMVLEARRHVSRDVAV